jgi:hypothetical protein
MIDFSVLPTWWRFWSIARNTGEERGIGESTPRMGASTLASGKSLPCPPSFLLHIVPLICFSSTSARKYTNKHSGGCQLQPVPYALQLLHKRKTVQLAYSRFSGLQPSLIPEIQGTIGSPKQWGYRTKITPHFDAPPKAARAAKEAREAQGVTEEEGMNEVNEVDTGVEEKKDWECRIGFDRKGRPGVLDIEVSIFSECGYLYAMGIRINS